MTNDTLATIPSTTGRWLGVYRRLRTAAKVVETLGKFAIAITVAQWLLEIPQRDKASVYQAWQVVNLASNQHGSGGRVEALQDLNRRHVDLSNLSVPYANLAGIQLRQARLDGADFRGAVLRKADFRGSELNLAKFSGEETRVSDAKFDGAHLDEADFHGVTVMDTTFTSVAGNDPADKTTLSRADFGHARIFRSAFPFVVMPWAHFEHAVIGDSDFRGVVAVPADFTCSNIATSDFDAASMIATFERSRMYSVRFRNADVSHARFKGAVLDTVDFSGAKVSETALRQASYMRNVLLPTGKILQKGRGYPPDTGCK
jgi:uncharacterized protein YjbI with pentapeptide repeats